MYRNIVPVYLSFSFTAHFHELNFNTHCSDQFRDHFFFSIWVSLILIQSHQNKSRERERMEDYIVRLIVLGVISWTLCFILLRMIFPKRSFSFCNRIVSTIHATLAVTLASLSVQDWSCPVCPYASPASPFQMQTLAVTLSYMIYDLFCCFFDGNGGINLDNSIHHLVSIIGIGGVLVYKMSGSEVVATLWVTEISSPFLHLRELLKELGYRDTRLNLAADISFASMFTFGRMIVGPYLTYVTLAARENPLIVKTMGSGLQLVSAFWFYKIVRMIRYKLFGNSKVSKTN